MRAVALDLDGGKDVDNVIAVRDEPVTFGPLPTLGICEWISCNMVWLQESWPLVLPRL